MPMLLILALLGLPVLELYVIVLVHDRIGWELTLLALIASSVLGVRLLRSQGHAVLQRVVRQLRANRPPGRDVLDGALVFAGGMLLIVPGFVTDAFGVVLLAPPTRAAIRNLIIRHYRSRLLGWVVSRPARRDYDVDATAVEIERPQLPR